MSALVLIVMVLDVLLATSVFIALSRPDVVIAFSFRHLGMGGAWFDEHLGEEELRRLRNLVRLGAWVGLATVFSWSFLAGVVLGLMQMQMS